MCIRDSPEQDAYFQLQLVVNDVFKAGLFKPALQDADLIAQTIWAGMHGVCALEITMAADTWVNWRDIASRLQMMQSVLISGLLKSN